MVQHKIGYPAGRYSPGVSYYRRYAPQVVIQQQTVRLQTDIVDPKFRLL